MQKPRSTLADHLKLWSVRTALNTLALVSPRSAGRKALQLFSTPRKGRYRDNQLPAWLANADEQLNTTCQGHEIRSFLFRERGPLILLAHGWESNSGRWRDLVRQLRSLHYSVLLVDAPAHGASGGGRFSALLYAQAMEPLCRAYSPSAIVGHSAGAMAAMYLVTQLEAPSVQKLSLLGMPVRLTTLLETYREFLGFSSRVASGLDKVIYEKYDQRPEWFDMSKFAQNLKSEGFLFHDPEDAIAPFSEVKAVMESWDKAVLYPLPGQGHGLRGKEVINLVTQTLA